DDEAVRPADAPHLAEQPAQVADVVQHQPEDDAVEGAAGERQRAGKVVEAEVHGLGPRLGPGALEHRLGEINRADAGAGGGEPQRVPAGATAEVEDRPPAHAAEQAIDPRLLQGDEWVLVLVVDLGPAVVAGARRQIDRGGRVARSPVHDSGLRWATGLML